MIVISDTTPLISFLKIGHLDLLKKEFGMVKIPRAVYDELTRNPRFTEEAKCIQQCSFIEVIDLEDTETVNILKRATGLDLGESEAIILTDKLQADLLLMDEAKGRMVAKQMDLKISGTIGILISAYTKGNLSADEIKASIEILKNSGRHIGEKLYNMLLEKIK